jgi:ribosomal protein L28
MARVCEITGRKTSTGFGRKHNRGKSGGVTGPWSRKAPATKRTWKPNLTTVRVLVAGVPKRMRISMKAYKQLRREGRIGEIVLRR